MIWGAITTSGPKGLVIFDQGKVDGDIYRTRILPVLRDITVKHRHEALFSQEPLIVQDNAPIHKAYKTMALFEDYRIVPIL